MLNSHKNNKLEFFKYTNNVEKDNFINNYISLLEDNSALLLVDNLEDKKSIELRLNSNFQNIKLFDDFLLNFILIRKKKIKTIKNDFTLIDDVDLKLFLAENIDNFNLKLVDEKELKNKKTDLINNLADQIIDLKKNNIFLKDFEKIKIEDFTLKIDLFNVYSKYEIYKQKNNYLDSFDVYRLFVELVKENKKLSDEIFKNYVDVVFLNNSSISKIKLSILEILNSKKIKTILPDNSTKIIEGKKSICKIIKANSQKSQLTFLVDNISKIINKNPANKIGIVYQNLEQKKEILDYVSSFGLNLLYEDSSNLINIPIIKDLINVIEVINSPKESDINWFYLFEKINLRHESIRKIYRMSKIKEKSIWTLLFKDIDSIILHEDERDIIKLLSENIQRLVALNNSRVEVDVLVKDVCDCFDFYNKLLIANNKNEIKQLNSFVELSKLLSKKYDYLELSDFIDKIKNLKNLGISSQSKFNSNSNIELVDFNDLIHKEYDYLFYPFFNMPRLNLIQSDLYFDVLNSFDEKFLKEKYCSNIYSIVNNVKAEAYFIYSIDYSNTSFMSKRNNVLDFLELNEIGFDKEYDSFVLSEEQKIRNEILEKINNLILNGGVKQAKEEIDLFASLFHNQNNSKNVGLDKFLNKEHVDLQKYKTKIDKDNYEDLNLNKDKMVYSVSQLKTYQQCPKKYLYSYIYRIPSLPKHYFDFGTSVHSVFEEILLDFDKFSKDVLFVKAIAILKKNWISKGYENESQEKEYFQKGVEAIRCFIDRELILRQENRKNIAIEEKFFLNFRGRKIMGFIDRIDKVDDKFEILDYKTSNSMQPKFKLKSDMQLYVYSLAINQIYNEFPKSVGLWYVVHDKIDKLKFEELNEEKMEKEILKLIEGIESKKFNSNPSKFACTYCDYNKICKNSFVD